MSSKLSAIAIAVLLSAMTAMATHGCLDVVVIHVDEPVVDAGPPRDLDASNDAPNACEACLRAPSDPGPGCADNFSVCAADPTCGATLDCALAAGCFELADQGAVIDCGKPCAVEAGVDPSSVSLRYVIELATCATTTCGPICRGEVPPRASRTR